MSTPKTQLGRMLDYFAGFSEDHGLSDEEYQQHLQFHRSRHHGTGLGECEPLHLATQDEQPTNAYTYPNGTVVIPTRYENIVPFAMDSLTARGHDPATHVVVNLDHIHHVIQGKFEKVDNHGKVDKEWTKTDAFYGGLCWPTEDWTMANPEILTDEEFAARITEPVCESVVPGLHGPGYTGKGAYWPICRAYDWWLGQQVIMIDVDDNPDNQPVTWERAKEILTERGLRPSFAYDTGSCRCLDGTHQRFRIVFVLDEVCIDAVAVANAIEGLRDVFGADPAIQRSSYLWGGHRVICSDFGARMSIDELLEAVGRGRPELVAVDDDDDWITPSDYHETTKTSKKERVHKATESGWNPFAGEDLSETFSRTDANLLQVADFSELVRRECRRSRDIDACSDPKIKDGDPRWPGRNELLQYGASLTGFSGGYELFHEQLRAAFTAHAGDQKWSRWDPAAWDRTCNGMKRAPVCHAGCQHYDECDHLFTRLYRGDSVTPVLEPVEPAEASTTCDVTTTPSSSKPRRWKPLKGLGEATDWMGDLKWAWRGWIPLQAITMMFGMPGIGKNWLAQHVAQVLTGQEDTFIDGTEPDCTVGDVLWIDYENEAGTTARRMRKGGFDPNKILSIDLADETQSVPMLTAKAKDGSREICTFIEEHAADHPELRLVVIDSLFGGTHGVGEKDSEFAAPLTDLTKVASKLGIAILVLHHPRKPNGVDSQDDTEVMVHTLTEADLRGTIAILGVIRSLIAIDRPADVPARRAYLRKTSYAEALDRRIGFTIDDARVIGCEPPSREKAGSGGKQTKSDDARDWLNVYLETGPKLRSDIQDAAAKQNFTWKMVDGVSRELGVVKSRVEASDRKSPYLWCLPQHVIDPSEEQFSDIFE